MPPPTHHLFFAYSCKDNKPLVDGGEGWITAFYRRLIFPDRDRKLPPTERRV